jgi:predicted lipoprotein with Yx(FWY)xxD motif
MYAFTHHHQPRAARRKTVLFAAALGGVAVAAAACGSSGSTASTASTSSTGSAGSSAPRLTASVVSTHATSLGTVLAAGRTVYLFEKDKGSSSECTGACASLWPPVTTKGMPTVTGQAQSTLLGTTRRSDGSMQVTYAGHPLYFFAGDHAAGDTAGEGLKDFGAGWYVLAPNGHKIDKD